MQKFFSLFLSILFCYTVAAQPAPGASITIKVLSEENVPMPGATVELVRSKDSVLVKAQMTDATGSVYFTSLVPGAYRWRVSRVGYMKHFSPINSITADATLTIAPILLQPSKETLANVTVTGNKPFIELQAGKTIVNVEGSITSVGATALEALEKMPGITIDKDGTIALKGRTGVTVMLDGKPTYLSSAELSNMLSGMNAAQISQVEIMDQPSARYDAAGNAGIINIKLKKNRQKGFNGSVTTAYTQGFYPKNNNNLQLAYRSGKWNLFANYSVNISQNFMRIYALRTYYKQDGITVASLLDQPSILKNSGRSHNLRTGVDYSIDAKTTIGLALTGIASARKGTGNNAAQWKAPNGVADSLIETVSNNRNKWKNVGANINFRRSFTTKRELTADLDMIGYRISGNQFFENNAILPVYYSEGSRAVIPSDIRILSGKADYTEQINKWKLEGGLKTSYITTDNEAAYEYRDGTTWKPDLGKTNHFLYAETIHAFYAAVETGVKKWTVQGGLRYEMTSYDAQQLGNAIVKDSSFSRSYNSLFPSFSASFAADSNHTFSVATGRRIDRPSFQKLNPFVFIINKYTYQKGNPFYRPQYTWNVELNHVYKNRLITGVSYSTTKDYFSQIFPLDSTGLVIYTEGNLGRLQNFGASVSVQLSPAKWWSLSGQAVLNHKKMEGFIDRDYKRTITQMSFNTTNSFRFGKGWTGELSGFYTSRSQADIQEIVDPAGQLSIGASKTILKNKGTVKLAARDLFYTQWMKGMTYFPQADEYFKLTRDTRVLTLSFTYRFGKAFKAARRSEGAAGDEIQRVGNG
ncbi:MAG TPA: outer membrane beta-barrel family protein [Chitinophagaceae bacterium]|nr:outer membrane beta-barrel family protein [Chitinophagaceae bacterium]